MIVEKGFVPLVAHPERTPFFYDEIVKREARGAKREKDLNFEVRSEKREAKPTCIFKKDFRISHLAPRVSRL